MHNNPLKNIEPSDSILKYILIYLHILLIYIKHKSPALFNPPQLLYKN